MKQHGAFYEFVKSNWTGAFLKPVELVASFDPHQHIEFPSNPIE
jgi:hypothetical protein